jgi:hypothetical protein
MNRDRKRELTAAYKERKVRAGVFVVRCEASGEAWVSATRELHNRRNSVWFSLRLGSHPNARMVAAWRANGEASFAYEELQVFEDETLTGWSLDQALKDAALKWREALDARAL